MEQPFYFSSNALARFVAAEGHTVEKVVCHLWQNRIDKNATLEIIDNMELRFTDGQKLNISCNSDGTGLDAADFDYASVAREIRDEFDDGIRLLAVDASGTEMWKGVIGLELLGVKVTKDGDYFLADSVMLDFGDEKREVRMAPADGLIIDYYE